MNTTEKNIREQVLEQVRLAKNASRRLALLTRAEKDRALTTIGKHLLADQEKILTANEQDMAMAKNSGQPAGYLDRLYLDEQRLNNLAAALEELTDLADPVGEVIDRRTRPNGLTIEQVRVPLGVIGMVYEARPNVTVDAAAIAFKTGNAIVLRGSRSARETNLALTRSMRSALESLGLPADAVQYLAFPEHEAVDALCTCNGLVDVIIPRGGAALIKRVLSTATVPVLETGVGNCHIFVDKYADYAMAEAIVINAKTSRPSVCNAAETLLLHREWPQQHRLALLTRLADAGVQLRACEQTRAEHPQLSDRLSPADAADWAAEYLDLIMAVRTVSGMEEALRHIADYGTGHSEAIVTDDRERAARFLTHVDAAAVYHNASTRFTDGGEFGFGAEIGISTQKLHARGPMGLEALTSYKYVIHGTGQIRK
jgi:glutamate-5-semialdehyde dehydrogenase